MKNVVQISININIPDSKSSKLIFGTHISKSSSAAGRTRLRPVKAKMKRGLTGRRPVCTATDNDFET